MPRADRKSARGSRASIPWRILAGAGVAITLAGVLVGIFVPRAQSHEGGLIGAGHTSTVYPEWVDPATGEVIEDLVPDYMPIWDRTGTFIAGVVGRDYILPRAESVPGQAFQIPGADEPWPVFDREGGVLVGYVLPGTGFVSLAELASGVLPEVAPATTIVGHP